MMPQFAKQETVTGIRAANLQAREKERSVQP